VKWDLDTNVSRRMAYNHYFGKPAPQEELALRDRIGAASHPARRRMAAALTI